MKKLLLILIAVALTFTLAACKTEPEPEPEVNVLPTISGVADVNLTVGEAFDDLDGVTAADEEDGNLTSSIVVSGTVDVDTAGTYVVTYSVTDSADETITATRNVVVSEVDVTFPTGFYN